jgi:hypothetical protein
MHELNLLKTPFSLPLDLWVERVLQLLIKLKLVNRQGLQLPKEHECSYHRKFESHHT